MDFHVGDRVILLSPTEENFDGWRIMDDSMNMYIGDIGVVRSIVDRGLMKFEVNFNMRYRSDGEEIRNYWYCKPEWLKLAEENVGVDDCAELDSMFSEYGVETDDE